MPACRYDLNGNLILFNTAENEEITTFPSRTICFALVSLLCNGEHKRTVGHQVMLTLEHHQLMEVYELTVEEVFYQIVIIS